MLLTNKTRQTAAYCESETDMRLFRQVLVSAGLGLNVFDFFLIFGIVLLTTQYMQLVLGLSPLQAGLWGLGPTVINEQPTLRLKLVDLAGADDNATNWLTGITTPSAPPSPSDSGAKWI